MHCARRKMNVSTQLFFLACYTLTVGFTLALGLKQDTEFTFLLPAGSTECFYQTTVRDDSMEVEYQVIAGSGLDVGFAIISPSGHRLTSDFRRSDGIHMVDPTEDGDYRLCFDNSFSQLSEKMVFFKVIINRRSGTGGARDEWADAVVTENMVEYRLEDVRAMMDFVYERLERTRQVQTMLKAFEARDRYLLEDNLCGYPSGRASTYLSCSPSQPLRFTPCKTSSMTPSGSAHSHLRTFMTSQKEERNLRAITLSCLTLNL